MPSMVRSLAGTSTRGLLNDVALSPPPTPPAAVAPGCGEKNSGDTILREFLGGPKAAAVPLATGLHRPD